MDIEVIDFECLNGVEAFDLQANGAFTDNTNLTWDLIGGLPNNQEGLTTDWVTFANADEWTVTLEAEHYGCESSVNFTWDAPASPIAAVADQSSFCQGFDFDFENLSQNGENWLWDFGVAGTNDDTSTEESPSYTYPGDGVYTVELIVTTPYTCPDTAYSTVEIFPEIDPAFEAPDPECFSTNNFSLMPLVENDPITTYSWDFGGETVSATVSGASVSNLVYAEPGTYTVEVTAIANGCEVTASEEVWVIADPSIGFQGGPPIGCPPHSVSFNNTSETETATTYLWNFGDGTTSISAAPVHIYENPGTYNVTLTMNTTGYCSQELMLTQSGLVEVQDIPNAGFDITPNQVDILNPVIEYETLATGNVLCYYNFGDGGSSSDCSGTYTFSDGGYFDVVQTVINEAGCTNTAVGQVAVSGSVFMRPTPSHRITTASTMCGFLSPSAFRNTGLLYTIVGGSWCGKRTPKTNLGSVKSTTVPTSHPTDFTTTKHSFRTCSPCPTPTVGTCNCCAEAVQIYRIRFGSYTGANILATLEFLR